MAVPPVVKTAPTTPVSANATPSPPGISGAPVQQTPVTPAAPNTPLQLTGTVVSSNPQTQQLNIQTQQGTIVVQTAASLPPDTQVSVELYTSNAQTRATVTVIRQNVTQPQADVITPDAQITVLPPLLEGTTVTALQLQQQPPSAQIEQPAVSPAQATQLASAPAQIEQLASSIEALKAAGVQDIPLPLPPQQMQELLTTPDIKGFLKQLPPQQLQDIASYFIESGVVQKQTPAENDPGILRQKLSAYLPQKSDEGATNMAAAPEDALPDILDNNLMQIMRAQLQAKATQQAIQSPPVPGNSKPAAFLPLTTPLDVLISSLGSSQKTSGFSSLLRQLIAQALPESAPAPQNMFQLRILRILPPETTPEQINAFLQKMPATAQTAEVETTTSAGQPILQTADEHFVVTTPVDVPVGSKIIYEARQMTPEEILQTAFSAARESDPPQDGSWLALQQALQALPPAGPQTAAAQAAAQSLRNTLPAPTQQLAPTSLFFLAALRSGSVSNWLGANTLQVLQQMGKKELVEILSSDFSRLSTQSKDVLTGDWRSISIPLHYDEQISQMQFYVRQQHDQSQQEKGQAGGKPATRFILNLNLSRMGALQLDGFIQKKNFDIILRTEDKLPFDMRQELMKRFAQGLDQVQMQGGISFQTRQQSWMVPEAGNMKAEA